MGRHEAPRSPKDESLEADPGATAPDGRREPRGKHARDGKDKGGKE
ncbi:MAG: hypothetical protein HOV97_17995 [Nonomuraea sp.]|nr:hypothetical protein [Nonomuraea sp.]NUS04438.1 hypothetical protein [Nonomuraea sp.]